MNMELQVARPLSTEPQGASQEFVQSLARGLGVIRVFGASNPAMTLSEVARRSGLPRAAVRRSPLTLIKLGYAGLNGQRFRLVPRVLELGYAYLSSLEFWEGIQPILERLAKSLGESCSVSVLDQAEIVYIARVQVKRIIVPTIGIGTRLPAFATAMGRVMLGGLAEDEFESYLKMVTIERFTPYTIRDAAALREAVAFARRENYAYIDQELELGLLSFAVPIFNRSRAIVAAMNTSVRSSRADSETAVSHYLPHLRAASEEAFVLFR